MSDPLVLPMPPRRKTSVPSQAKLLLALVVCAAVVAGWWLYSGRVVTQQGELEGVLVPIPAPMTATVVEVLVPEGALVRTGEPLARLDNGSYKRQEAEARAMVRGVRPPRALAMEDASARVADAQAAEEYIVRRVALARHEEAASRQLMERSVMEHVQAELRMRGLEAGRAPATTTETARKAEAQARQRKETAQAAFETASRSRAAVENELMQVRRELEKARSGQAATATREPSPMDDPSVLRAPQDGRVVGSLAQGQMLARGETVLRLAPATPSHLWALVWVPAALNAQLRPGMLSVVRPEGLAVTLMGLVDTVENPGGQPMANRDFLPVRIRISDTVPGELAAQLPGRGVRAEIWTRDAPGLGHVARFIPF